MYFKMGVGLIVLSNLLAGVAIAQTSPTKTDTRQDPRFGTDPARNNLPDSAINASRPPNIVLKANARGSDPLPYFRIGPDTYMFFGNVAEVDRYNRGFNGNAGFIVTREGVVVIDALGSPKLGRRMISTIRMVTNQPIRYLILTHNHPDHAYGAIAFRQLDGITVIGHKGMLRYLESERLERSVDYRRSFIPDDMAGFKPVHPDVLVDGRLYSKHTIRLGGRTFDIYNVSDHHSFGDLIVLQQEDGIVWISDLAFNQRVTYMGDGNSKRAVEVQDWLLKKFAGARLMVPGHGSAQRPPFPMVRKTQDYMKRLRSFTTKAMQDGLSLQETVDQMDFPEWRKVRLYELNHRPNANFVYLEMEQDLF